MSEKVTMPILTARLALRTGDTKKESEDFVRELFALIGEMLEKGESVKVNGLGVFKTIDVEQRKSVDVSTGQEMIIPTHRKVVFMPDKELAATVNEPFEMFRSVEIGEPEDEDESGDAIDAEEAMLADAPMTPPMESAPESTADFAADTTIDTTADTTIDTTTDTATDTTVEYQAETQAEYQIESKAEFPDEPQAESSVDESAAEFVEEEVVEEGVIEDKHDTGNSGEHEEPKKKPRSNYWIGFCTGVVATCLLALISWNIYGIFAYGTEERRAETRKKEAMEKERREKRNAAYGYHLPESPASADTVTAVAVVENVTEEVKAPDAAPTKPSDAKKYDTISKTRYLTTMAKDHYGNYHLWPYIYKANAQYLGHPDRIKPGTKVVIPDLKDYGVDPSNPEDIKRAKELGVQIYSRFR